MITVHGSAVRSSRTPSLSGLSVVLVEDTDIGPFVKQPVAD